MLGEGESFSLENIAGGKSPWSSAQPVPMQPSKSNSVGRVPKGVGEDKRIERWSRIRSKYILYIYEIVNKLFKRKGRGMQGWTSGPCMCPCNG